MTTAQGTSSAPPKLFQIPPAHEPALRLRLDPTLCRRGAVDGAWWPRSDNASDELPCLVAELDHRLGIRILRVGLHADAWSHIPRRMQALGRIIKVGWFRSIDTHLISLHTDNGRYDLKLLVIPPQVTAGEATIAFRLATRGRSTASPADILAAARTMTRDSDKPAGHAWGDERERLTRRLSVPPPGSDGPSPARQAASR